ncbi:uncharacterized protein LOC131317183 [Rhododendron vialii]|uniref:uncharacterized protein LOC131317183 n=1 Tax=Rhododendron vialii TaxID=182163 RepID=UPI00266015DD|nr:uncharacterized protein LOC131317183 [Rhododendron vialii]
MDVVVDKEKEKEITMALSIMTLYKVVNFQHQGRVEEEEAAVVEEIIIQTQEDANNQVEEQAHFVEEKEIEVGPTLLLAVKQNEELGETFWYLDNGASNHMCGDKRKFVELDETWKGYVTFGDSSNVPIMGKGTILIHLKNGDHRIISDVYFVPKMKSNILSLGQFLERGYEILIKDRCLSLKDERNNLVAKVSMTKNRMFLLNIQTNVAKCLKASVKDMSW